MLRLALGTAGLACIEYLLARSSADQHFFFRYFVERVFVLSIETFWIYGLVPMISYECGLTKLKGAEVHI